MSQLIWSQDEFRRIINSAIQWPHIRNWLKKYFPLLKPIRRITICWINELFLQLGTKTSTKLAISFSLTFKVMQSHTSPSTLFWKQRKKVNYSADFLNSVDSPVVAQYVLHLKIGVRVIMLGIINQRTIFNGTNNEIKKMYIISAEVVIW